jgi:hypothetical protein
LVVGTLLHNAISARVVRWAWIKLTGLPYHSFLILPMTIREFWPKTYTHIYIKYIYILTQTCTSMYISWIHSTFIHSHPGAECDYFKTSAQNLKKYRYFKIIFMFLGSF